MSTEILTIDRSAPQKLETIRERFYSNNDAEDVSLLGTPALACTSTSSASHQLEDDDEDIVAAVSSASTEEYGFVNHKIIYPEDAPLILSSSTTTPTNRKQNNNSMLDTPTANRFSVPFLPKTFTEPANLSELLKNVSSNFNKKFLLAAARVHATPSAISPSESLISVDARNLHKKIRSRRQSYNDGDDVEENCTNVVSTSDDGDFNQTCLVNDENFEGGKNFKSPLLQGSSSFHLRQKDYNTKVDDICGQCPRCSKHGRMNSLHPNVGYFNDGRSCPCRICRLLNPATSPSLVSPTSLEKQELGALCQVCGQNGKALPDGRCQKYSCVDINSEGHTGLVSSSSIVGGHITCREQGVQVSKWSLSSVSSCSGPLCRICHSPGDKIESLMSPCRCSGSLKYVHMSCLLRWLEISRRKLHRAPHCELCGYKYQRHKIMRFRRFQCPPCSRRDKFLHITFILSIMIMIVCACTTIICFKSDRTHKNPNHDKIELSGQEIVTLVCGVMFFCAFFLAMYVQVKAQATIYKLLLRFWLMNQEWQIEEYRRERDIEYSQKNKTDSICSSV